MIEFGSDIVSNPEAARRREWLETNGLGGFSSSTIIGLNTRRYHGLLIAAVNPPVGRMSLLSKLEETLVIDGERFELSANQYPGAVHPNGYEYLRRFRLDPFPVFTYSVNGVEIEKSLFLVHGENTLVVQYKRRKKSGSISSCLLELRPLASFRDYHSLTHENEAFNRSVQLEQGRLRLQPYTGLPELHISHDADSVEITGDWYRSFQYTIERDRGLDFQEDLLNPCVLTFDLTHRTSAGVVVSTEAREFSAISDYRKKEVARRKSIAQIDKQESGENLLGHLKLAADQFIVARGGFKTVIAGYHWFCDWGRDTMIALPGLTLSTGRSDDARKLLLAFAEHVDQGMLPNRFPDAGEQPEYNTVDATLWYFEAIRALLASTGDHDFVCNNLYHVLVDIIDWHKRGARYGIRVDGDGLLAAGEHGVQLTWMDAKVGDWVVTPRRGKPVEIQALWYNALRVTEQIALRAGDPAFASHCGELAARASDSFQRTFWNEDEQCLYDVIEGDLKDASIRPNQIIAVSLEHSMLSPERARAVVQKVEDELLTPFGLRTLAQRDPRYRGRYDGGIESRDGAYHQGTVWPWLIGPFITAYLKVHGNSRKARSSARQMLLHFGEHLRDAGLGQISEIFDGDPPYHPRGCVAQAWSVAEVLRVLSELNSDPAILKRDNGRNEMKRKSRKN
ncbi:MAG: amylo-alpha-1,6-glucosidase [Acidobacteria bacterium]|nr:amylo-alpha-1,6-glucosidase [Acidobacteriota bacterium]